MGSIIQPVVLGLLISIMGYCNIKGNISSVHWYHRTRISDENKPVFGKTIGLGTIIIGLSLIIMGLSSFIALKTEVYIFETLGYAVVIIGTIVGLIMSVYAIIKYNKGIF